MKVIIIGGGIAGKSCAYILRNVNIPSISSITVLEASDGTNSSINSLLYTGLWSPALNILEYYNDSVVTAMNIQYVNKSGYRTVTGKWLANPSDGLMGPSKDSLRLGFVRNDKLLRLLDYEMPSVEPSAGKVTIEYCTTVEAIIDTDESSSALVIAKQRRNNTTNCKKYEADLIIAADGAYSGTRKQVLSKEQKNGSTVSESPVQYRGYDVYRGHCSWEALLSAGYRSPEAGISPYSVTDAPHHFLSFQTWGAGRRFAAVPTADGVAWFAAMTNSYGSTVGSTSPTITMKAPFASTGDNVIGSSVQNRDEREALQLAEHSFLKSEFSNWHNPIPLLIKSTAPQSMIKGPAAASHYPVDGGYSGIYAFDNKHSTAVAFIGDAAHTLDPILAQGAGVAIEDSYHLANALNDAFSSINDQTTKSTIDKQVLSRALRDYEQKRAVRVKRLHNVSNLAQLVGHINNSYLVILRDIAMGYLVPSYIKQSVFDYFINYIGKE